MKTKQYSKGGMISACERDGVAKMTVENVVLNYLYAPQILAVPGTSTDSRTLYFTVASPWLTVACSVA